LIYRPGGNRVRDENTDWSPIRWTSLAPLTTLPQYGLLLHIWQSCGPVSVSADLPHHMPTRTPSSPAFSGESVRPVSSLRLPGCCGSRTRPTSPCPRWPCSKPESVVAALPATFSNPPPSGWLAETSESGAHPLVTASVEEVRAAACPTPVLGACFGGLRGG
jgi:hypothetical protein